MANNLFWSLAPALFGTDLEGDDKKEAMRKLFQQGILLQSMDTKNPLYSYLSGKPIVDKKKVEIELEEAESEIKNLKINLDKLEKTRIDEFSSEIEATKQVFGQRAKTATANFGLHALRKFLAVIDSIEFYLTERDTGDENRVVNLNFNQLLEYLSGEMGVEVKYKEGFSQLRQLAETNTFGADLDINFIPGDDEIATRLISYIEEGTIEIEEVFK